MITESLPRLESDLDTEFDLKEKEVEWLDKVGKVLAASAYYNQQNSDEEIQVKDDTQRAHERWDKLKDLWERRVNR